MPDHDRAARFLHTVSPDLEAGVRCSSCPDFRVTFQADCVWCGREVAHHDSKPDSAKPSLGVKSEVVSTAPLPQSGNQAVPVDSQPPKGPRTAKGRHRPLHSIPVARTSSFQRVSDRRECEFRSPGVLPGGPRNAVRVFRSSASRKSTYVPRGSSATKVGAHQEFKGIRTRKGVKGFLVEIRPPKWKKTIWLGTYNTDVEAAGAFDAGVFYTNKPDTKYNFRALEGAFPPLPSHLRLDKPDNMEEIKLFVQKQAKQAAATARRLWSTNTITGSAPQQFEVLKPVAVSTEATTSDATPSLSSSDSCLTNGAESTSFSGNNLPTTPDVVQFDNEFLQDIPLDFEYLRDLDAENWIAELQQEL